MRHLVKYMRGDTDENHIRAAAWNIMWALEQSVTRPELIDVPFNRNIELQNSSETQHSETKCRTMEHIQQRFERVM